MIQSEKTIESCKYVQTVQKSADTCAKCTNQQGNDKGLFQIKYNHKQIQKSSTKPDSFHPIALGRDWRCDCQEKSVFFEHSRIALSVSKVSGLCTGVSKLNQVAVQTN